MGKKHTHKPLSGAKYERRIIISTCSFLKVVLGLPVPEIEPSRLTPLPASEVLAFWRAVAERESQDDVAGQSA